MSEIKTLKQIVQAMILAIVPIIITEVPQLIFGKIPSILNVPFLLIAYIISAVVIFFFNKCIGKFKRFRKYKKYEGKWIEIIPGFPRSISVCNLYFKDNEYHFDGVNYGDLKNESVEFTSKKFIEAGSGEFYYITESNHVRKVEGFGKVFSFKKQHSKLMVAKGYFLDIAEKENIHVTKMIKYDENFYNTELKLNRDVHPENFTDREIYDSVKEYVENNYNLEVSI